MTSTGAGGLVETPKDTVENPSKNDPWSGIITKKPEPEVEPEPEPEATEQVEEIQTEEVSPEPVENNEVSEEDVPDPPEEEVESEPNPYYYLSGQLKSDGFLPDEFEATEDVAGIDVYNAYRKKLETELGPQIEQEVYTKLENQGINQNDLVIARALREGVDVSLLSEATMHERYANTPNTVSESEKIEAIRAMYKSRNFSDREIENQISIATAVNEETEKSLIDEYFAESKEFHNNKWDSFKNQEQQRAALAEQQQRQELEAAENLVRSVLAEKTVFGEKLSEKESAILRDAIYSPSDTIEYEGKQYSVSKLYKFNYLLGSDPELKLWLFKKYLFKDTDLESIKTEVEKEMEADMLKAYELSVKKDLKAKNDKNLNKKLEETKVEVVDEDTGKNTFYIEL